MKSPICLILFVMAAASCVHAPQQIPGPAEPVRPAVPEGYLPRFSDEEFLTPERLKAFNNLRIYEVMVESFVDGDPRVGMGAGYGTSHHQGDLRGIIKSLDYIKSMGFNALWITPIFFTGGTSKLDATGYYPQDYFSVDPHFGSLEEARELVREAHSRGMYVLFDAVFGHSSLGVKPSPTGKVPVIKPKGAKGSTLFYDRGEVQRESLDFFIEVATWWIRELEIDGWRLDVAYELKQGGHIYWQEIRQAVQDLCMERSAAGHLWGTLGFLVAETWKSSGEITSLTFGKATNKGVFHAFDFPLRYELMNVLATGEGNNSPHLLGDAVHLSAAFSHHSQAPEWGHYSLMLGNHDLVRFGDLIQRAQGLRYGPEHPGYWKRHKLAFAFQAAYTGPIMTYYGEEIGDHTGSYPGGEDFIDRIPHTPATPAADWGVAEDHVARTSGKIDGITTVLSPEQKDLKNYLSTLWALRAAHPALFQGTRTPLTVGGSLYADLKTQGDERIIFAANLGTEEVSFSWDIPGQTVKSLGPELIPGTFIQGKLTGTLPALTSGFFLIQ